MRFPSSTPADEMLSRRETLKLALAAPAVSALVSESPMATDSESASFRIIDTNISLFQWPFQRLPLDTIPELVRRLRSLGVTQAWAGSFEGLLHRDTTAVNNRLAEACIDCSDLIPIGSINPMLPGWQEDLERCLQHHQMPGVRLHPNYHGYVLTDNPFIELLKRCSDSGCFVQIAVSMEDNRTQSTLVQAADVDLSPLGDVLSHMPAVRVQLLNCRLRPAQLGPVRHLSNVTLDTARVDGTDAIPQLVKAVGQERVLFGSHSPFLIPEAAMIRVHESQQLDTASLSAIYRDNALQFAAGESIS